MSVRRKGSWYHDFAPKISKLQLQDENKDDDDDNDNDVSVRKDNIFGLAGLLINVRLLPKSLPD